MKKGRKKWLIALVAAALGVLGIVKPQLVEPLGEAAAVLLAPEGEQLPRPSEL